MNVIYSVASFYHFANWNDAHENLSTISDQAQLNNIYGTILIANEGINGTVAGEKKAINNFINFIKNFSIFSTLQVKYSMSNVNPFKRMKVRFKKEIVALKQDRVDTINERGSLVSPEDWNHLIEDGDTLVLDTRNIYEHSIGSFKNATKVSTNSFREFPQWVENNLSNKDKKIAMYCTGGIRCEKASAFLKNNGFNKVYQLEGGILNYIEKTDENNSLWDGECFVFDDRVSLDSKLKPGKHLLCYACRTPITFEDTQKEDYIKGVSCHNCISKLTKQKKDKFTERQRQVDIASKQGLKHIGQKIKKKHE